MRVDHYSSTTLPSPLEVEQEVRPFIENDAYAAYRLTYDRLAAYALMAADGGLVEHYTGPDDEDGPLSGLASADRERWLAQMEPLESLYFVGHAGPAAVLMQSAREDELVPATDAERFHAAASEPKTVLWYDSGHALPAEAGCDTVNWLADHIGIHPARYASNCG